MIPVLYDPDNFIEKIAVALICSIFVLYFCYENFNRKTWQNILKTVGAILITWGFLDFVLSWMQIDLYGYLDIQISNTIYQLTHYIFIGVGCTIYYLGKLLGKKSIDEDINVPNPRDKKSERYKIVTVYSGWFTFYILLILALGVFYYPLFKHIIFSQNLDLNLNYEIRTFSYDKIIYFYEFLEKIYINFKFKIFQLSNVYLILFSTGVFLSIIILIYHLLKKQKFPKKQILKKSIIIILVTILTFLLFLFYIAYFK